MLGTLQFDLRTVTYGTGQSREGFGGWAAYPVSAL